MFFDQDNRLYRNNCGNSSGDTITGNTQLFHRGCCHNFDECDEDYYSPMQTAINDALESEMEEKEKVTFSDLKKAYKRATINEEKYNTEQNPLGACCLLSMFAAIYL